MTNIAFIGLGVMGGPMAAHLARAGHNVTAWNRTGERADRWRQDLERDGVAASTAASAAEAASRANIIITCVGNDADLRQVVLGPGGIAEGAAQGSLFIDHSTVSPTTARDLGDALAQAGVASVDAPVSGGQAGAEKGALSIMCGGTDDAVARARPVMAAYGARIVHIGGAGAGQAAKAVNQICIAGILGGLSEGLRFAQAAGLDPDRVFEAISGGAAQSWQMENRWQTMAQDQFDFGFAVDWMRKDLAIALDEARANGASLPVAALVDQFYARVQALGGARQDTSALVRHLDAGDRA